MSTQTITLIEAMAEVGQARIETLTEEAADLGVPDYDQVVTLVAERVTEDLDRALAALLERVFTTPVNRAKPVRGSELLEKAIEAVAHAEAGGE